ncbi:PepSY-like domain-containing protein [Brachyspira innocens]|uniref:PepSY-like domain-containing protein n=1 Tax=Brachyspira innocens TaxID=13264 RepID=A0ABT8YZ71_9SPIR|nr:PepSY-like domain-containing protein [Brachyspira innocens]MDO6992465.1 PepSY-like domain-containing protein [Brachyspira innocens]MDO7020538.1 PepSY-like domain-containing protein [Brachyspira innocens]
MKRNIYYILIVFIYLTSSSFLFFDDERNINFIPYTSLPINIQEFVNKYFNDYKVYSASVSSQYTVIFEGGSSINFNRKGEWTSVIGNRQTIAISTAEKFIDSKIINIIKSKYKTINNIYKRRKGIEFKADDKEYIYIDYEGNIIKIKKS